MVPAEQGFDANRTLRVKIDLRLVFEVELAIDESVVGYLATRIERSYAAARQAVDRLDREALRLGRPVTRVLAAELLRDA